MREEPRTPPHARAKIKAQIGYKKHRGAKSGPPATVAPNHVQQQFDVAEPDRIWVSDITYIRTYACHRAGPVFMPGHWMVDAITHGDGSCHEGAIDGLVAQAAYWRSNDPLGSRPSIYQW